MNKPRIVIASLVAPHYVGGLAAYMRDLSANLEAFVAAGTFQCIQQRHSFLSDAGRQLPWPILPLKPRIPWGLARRLLSRLAARPYLHPLLEQLLHYVLPNNEIEKSLRGAAVVHFVGTGWDLLGFSLLKAARRNNVRFTVCPAIHPHAWGDDTIDIRLYQKADAVICFSQNERRHLESNGISKARLKLCGLPPMCQSDGDGIAFRAKFRITQEPLVLFLGRRDEGKGYPALLKAWPHVLREQPDARLVVGGPAATRAALPVPGEDRFLDLGVPDEGMKADAIAACDLFCLPSAHESFGVVYVEAWSYGKPVICGLAPASRELVEDGKAGLWSDGSPLSIAEKVIYLLRNSTVRRELGEAGRRLQHERFTNETMVASHMRAWGLSAPDRETPDSGNTANQRNHTDV